MTGARTAQKQYTLLGPDGPYASRTKGTFGGWNGGNSPDRKIYGRLDCKSALARIARGQYVGRRVFFADEAAAIAAGYRPCGVCMKAEYAAWKNLGSEEQGHPSATAGSGDLRHRAGSVDHLHYEKPEAVQGALDYGD